MTTKSFEQQISQTRTKQIIYVCMYSIFLARGVNSGQINHTIELYIYWCHFPWGGHPFYLVFYGNYCFHSIGSPHPILRFPVSSNSFWLQFKWKSTSIQSSSFNWCCPTTPTYKSPQAGHTKLLLHCLMSLMIHNLLYRYPIPWILHLLKTPPQIDLLLYS